MEIEIPEYIKDYSKDVEFYLKCVQESENGLCSASGVAQLASLTNDPEFDCSIDSLYRRMRKARDISFGNPRTNSEAGLYGTCKYVWCIKISDRPNHYRFLTKEEDAKFDELIGFYYMSNPAKVKREALLNDSLRAKEISVEDYFTQLDKLEIHSFSNIIHLFKGETGLQIVRATEHEVIQSMLAEIEFEKEKNN